MVRFIQKLDRNNKVYIAKSLRQAGLFGTIEIVHNANAAVFFPAETTLEDVLASLDIIRQDIEHRLRMQRRAQNTSDSDTIPTAKNDP
jgi:hypothetical protein